MILTKDFPKSNEPNETVANNTIQLLVGNDTFCVEEKVLSRWSEEYVKLMEEDEPVIFLQDFIGHSEDVEECVALLNGLEVDAKIDNIAVKAKFADKFKIKELNEQIECWFGDSINQDNLRDIIQIVGNMSELKLSVINNLTDIIRKYLLKYLTVCVDIITEQTIEINTFMLDLLLDDDTLFSNFIPVIISQLHVEDDYTVFLSKLEQLADSKLDLLLQKKSHIQKFTDKLLEIDHECDPNLWKRCLKLTKMMFMGNPGADSLKTVPVFQSWRKFTVDEIKMLQKNENLSEYQYVVICLDWIETQIWSIQKKDIKELFNQVHKYLALWIKKFSTKIIRNYSSITSIKKAPVCLYKTETWRRSYSSGKIVELSKYALHDCVSKNKPMVLSERCKIKDCTKEGFHLVVIKFNKTDDDRLQIERAPISQSAVYPDHNHSDTHHYVNWYFFYHNEHIFPTFTKSYTELKHFVSRYSSRYGISCVMQEKITSGNLNLNVI